MKLLFEKNTPHTILHIMNASTFLLASLGLLLSTRTEEDLVFVIKIASQALAAIGIMNLLLAYKMHSDEQTETKESSPLLPKQVL